MLDDWIAIHFGCIANHVGWIANDVGLLSNHVDWIVTIMLCRPIMLAGGLRRGVQHTYVRTCARAVAGSVERWLLTKATVHLSLPTPPPSPEGNRGFFEDVKSHGDTNIMTTRV